MFLINCSVSVWHGGLVREPCDLVYVHACINLSYKVYEMQWQRRKLEGTCFLSDWSQPFLWCTKYNYVTSAFYLSITIVLFSHMAQSKWKVCIGTRMWLVRLLTFCPSSVKETLVICNLCVHVCGCIQIGWSTVLVKDSENRCNTFAQKKRSFQSRSNTSPWNRLHICN